MDVAGRIQRLIVTPREEWQVIDGEQTAAVDLYRSYIAPLAAIGPIAMAIREIVFGISAPLGVIITVHPASAIVSAVTGYLFALISVYVFAVIIDNLAPYFGGTRSMSQALKVAAYSGTAVWLAGVFTMVPQLSFLGLLGLYSLYLLYVGLPMLMKAPSEQALGYTLVSIGVAIVLSVITGFLVGVVGTAVLRTVLR